MNVLPTKSGTQCLDDSVLAAIASGRLGEPTLGHYLAHMEHCLDCCRRCDFLSRDRPTPVIQHLNRLGDHLSDERRGGVVGLIRSLEKTDPDLRVKESSGRMRALQPSLANPELPEAGADGEIPFGRLRLRARLGEGRTSVVYRALDTELGREVAVKILRPTVARSPAMVDALLREAKALAGVRDPHLVVPFSYGREPVPHLEMELLEGRSLSEVLAEGPMEPARAVRVTAEIAGALASLHRAGLLHRDVKPGNIRLIGGPRGERAVLLDLGLAGLAFRGAGTPGFIAPELLAGTGISPTPAADIFALGALLRVISLGWRDGRPLGDKPDPSLVGLTGRMMRSDPFERPDADAVCTLAAEWLASRRPDRRRVIAAVAGGTAVLAGTAALWALWRGREQGIRPASSVPRAFGSLPASGVDLLVPVAGGWLGAGEDAWALCGRGTAGSRGPERTPGNFERYSAAGSLLAAADENNDVQVFDTGKFPPKKIVKISNKDQRGRAVRSLSLDPNGAARLVIHRPGALWLADLGPSVGPAIEARLLSPIGELFTEDSITRVAWVEGQPDRLIGVTTNGGLQMIDIKKKNDRIYAFRPLNNPVVHLEPVPGGGGALVTAALNGEIALYGPEIDPGPAPFLKPGLRNRLNCRILGIRLASPNLVVAHTDCKDRPLVLLDIAKKFETVAQLACLDPWLIELGKKPGEVVCLTSSNRLLTWNL